MPEEMKVSSESADGAVVLSPQGDVDLARSPALRQALRQAQTAKPSRLIVDLSGVDYMDSSGVATLVEALQIARRGSTKMVLCGLKDRVRSIFEIARLDTVFSIAGTREEAMRA
jgi:anti-sigma B factor antagonist